MLHILDRVFAILPALIVLYHAVNLLDDSQNIYYLSNIILTYIIGSTLKSVFKKIRIVKSYVHRPLPFISKFEKLKTHYGFPSCHAMFYFQYFLNLPSTITFLLFVFGASLRVIYEHHTSLDVLGGCIFVIFYKVILYFLKYFLYS